MSKVCILDASAALAYLNSEKGQDLVEATLDGGPCSMSTVNVCEVITKLIGRGMQPDDAWASIVDLGLTITDFDVPTARLAAALVAKTKSIGASLGDRACLAYAQKMHGPQTPATVYTAEKSWARLTWPFKITLIR